MKIQSIVYALVALAVAAPGVAWGGINVTATVSAPPGDVAAGATVQVNCWAEGTPASSMLSNSTTRVDSIAVTVSGGTVTPSTVPGTAVNQPCSADASKTCSVLAGAVAWATATTPGAFTATCTASWTTTTTPAFGGTPTTTTGATPASATLTTVASPYLPPVVSTVGGLGQVVIGEAATFSVTATDPNSPALPLTYGWTATGGSIAWTEGTATWTAPDAAGTYTVTATVTNGAGQASTASLTVNVILGGYQGALAATMSQPRRLCTDGAANVYAVDGRTGSLLLLTAKGELKGSAKLSESAMAVGSGPGVLYVTTGTGKLLRVDPATSRSKGEVVLSGGPLYSPAGVAYEPTRMRIWIAETSSNRVRVVAPDGTTAFILQFAGAGVALRLPVDVAVDAAGSRVWVVLQEGSTDGKVAHAFDYDGVYQGSAVGSGTGAGQITRAGGVTVDGAGQLYLSDTFQGLVQSYTASGSPRGTYGASATEVELKTPLGLGILGNGNLLVANLGSGRVERFGTVSALPTCTGDEDCDGLPDAWENAYGLNRKFAGDAFLDADGDGLNNAEELAYGTDPSKKDTDGDGFDDGWEIANGFDPLNPYDHGAVPQLVASGPAAVGPGLVRLTASVVGAMGPCTVGWTATGGPEAVTLHGAPGLSPSFIARKAGTYTFEARAECGTYTTPAAAVNATIRDVPPLIAAGGMRVVAPDTALTVDASATSDANEASASVLSFAWDQALGPVVAFAGTGPLLTAQMGAVGYHEFAVTATDPGANAATAAVPVLVASGATATAVVTSPVRGTVGSPVLLDASGSFVPQADATFSWEQVSGPAATVESAGGALAQFTPPEAGRYGFQVWIGTGGQRSPPGRIDVYVAAPGGRIPLASIARVGTAQVGTAVQLDGTGSRSAGGTLAYAWRQVAGPAAGLDDPTSATPTVVPFAAGSHEFELEVKDGALDGLPARVRFDAVVADQPLPVAVARHGSGGAKPGDVVTLDGTGSRGAERFAWTQVGGPWAVLDDATAPAPSFVAPAAGRYVFELVVERAGARSGPAIVKVVVGGAR